MHMSNAALPPTQPAIPASAKDHQLFPLYQQHRSFCSNHLIEASSWDGWLYQHEANMRNEDAAKHPRYPAFLDWMHETKAGGRPCCPSEDLPRGLVFPLNFYFWLDGGRW